MSEKRSLLKAVCPFPFAEEGRWAAIASDWRQLEEFRLLTQNVTQQQVGQAACAQAEQAVVQPFFAQYFFNDGVVYQCIVHCVDASGGLETADT